MCVSIKYKLKPTVKPVVSIKDQLNPKECVCEIENNMINKKIKPIKAPWGQ